MNSFSYVPLPQGLIIRSFNNQMKKQMRYQNERKRAGRNLFGQIEEFRCIAIEEDDLNYVLHQASLIPAESLGIQLTPNAAYQLDRALGRGSNDGAEDLHRRIDRWISTIRSTKPSAVTRVSPYLLGVRQ